VSAPGVRSECGLIRLADGLFVLLCTALYQCSVVHIIANTIVFAARALS